MPWNTFCRSRCERNDWVFPCLPCFQCWNPIDLVDILLLISQPPAPLLVKHYQIVLKVLLRLFLLCPENPWFSIALGYVSSHTASGLVLSLMHTLYCFIYPKLFYLLVPCHTFLASFSLAPVTSLHFSVLLLASCLAQVPRAPFLKLFVATLSFHWTPVTCIS